MLQCSSCASLVHDLNLKKTLEMDMLQKSIMPHPLHMDQSDDAGRGILPVDYRAHPLCTDRLIGPLGKICFSIPPWASPVHKSERHGMVIIRRIPRTWTNRKTWIDG